MRHRSRSGRLLALLLLTAAALVVGACSSDDGDAGSDGAPATTEAPADDGEADDGEAEDEGAPEEPTLRIVLANDDGIDNPGLELMLQSLLELPDVEVDVVAPVDNQSGTGGSTTEGGAAYEPGVTDGGYEGTAVDGFPVDAVIVALDELGLDPHLVVSGINDAQNIGPFAELSGTVGVARYAVSRGIPAVAVSAGLQFDEDQFSVGADLATEWIEEHRDALLDRTMEVDVAISINIPTCDPADMGDAVEVPRAEEFPDDAEPFTSDCDLADPDPADDVAALRTGNPAISRIPPEF